MKGRASSFTFILGHLLDLLLEGLKFVNVILLLGRVVLKSMLSELTDLHAVIL